MVTWELPHNSPSPQHPPTAFPKAFPEKKCVQQGQPPASELPCGACWHCSQRQIKPRRSQGRSHLPVPSRRGFPKERQVYGACNWCVWAETKPRTQGSSSAGTEPAALPGTWQQGNKPSTRHRTANPVSTCAPGSQILGQCTSVLFHWPRTRTFMKKNTALSIFPYKLLQTVTSCSILVKIKHVNLCIK